MVPYVKLTKGGILNIQGMVMAYQSIGSSEQEQKRYRAFRCTICRNSEPPAPCDFPHTSW